MSLLLGRIAARLAREGLLRHDAPAIDSVPVEDITADSRAVTPGSLFCAIRGTSGDGHDYLAAAEAAGAAAALVEERAPLQRLPQLEVADGRKAAAFAAAEFFGDPWNGMTLIGVTGTNGKTTTAAMLRHLLAARGEAASIGTLGLIGTDGAVVPGTEGLTTPGPVDLARWLRKLSDDGVDAVAMEVSSHALHQARPVAARFDAVIFTNLSRDHLDYHGTFEEYWAAKLLLTTLVKPGGAVVLNADDPAWRDVPLPAGVRRIRFGFALEADVRAEELRSGPRGMQFELHLPGASVQVELPVFGAYNVANALGCAAALWSLGAPAAGIARSLESLPQVPGRLERVELPAGLPTIVIDYAHTPDALDRALGALRPLVQGELVVIFGAGGDRDRGKRPEMGRVAATGADRVIVTSDNPRTEDPEAIADDIEAGMGGAPHLRILDRRAAIRHALEHFAATDLVLLAGKGHETYQIRGTEKFPFDERQVIREILSEIGVAP